MFGGTENDVFNFNVEFNVEETLTALTDPTRSNNKRSMQVFKSKVEKEKVKYIQPHESPLKIPRVDQLRVFALGPPRDMAMLSDTDPQGHEAFPLTGTALRNDFATAVLEKSDPEQSDSPFASRYSLPWEMAKKDPRFYSYFGSPTPKEASENSWRKIDYDSLNAAEQFALAMGNDTNNASLVLAFELGEGGKVLLFAADAQRGNWLSWDDADWTDGEKKISAKDLLARTVLYKVGHHGSHNATLSGKIDDTYPNLDWMARGKHANEFTAMITAVRAWAETQKGWDHPQKAIKDALLQKAAGRVFQTDTDLTTMDKLAKPFVQNAQNDWDAFEKRRTVQDLYFDYTIEF
jgi:hypothetical protein